MAKEKKPERIPGLPRGARPLTLRDLKRLPSPFPETKEQKRARTEQLLRVIGATDPKHPMHVLFCSKCAADGHRREREREIRLEAERQLRVEDAKYKLRGARADAASSSKPAGEDLDKALEVMVRQWPKRGAPWLTKELAAQGIRRDRSTVSKHLTKIRTRLAK